jgi:hypothetical protein
MIKNIKLISGGLSFLISLYFFSIGHWGWAILILLISLVLISIHLFEKLKANKMNRSVSSQDSLNCQKCKSPNLKNTPICEWCGGTIV